MVDEEGGSQVTLILVKLPAMTDSGFGTRFLLLVPPGYALSCFRRLVYSGCRAIALKEYLSICMEAQRRCFPYDYPECEAGRHWAKRAMLRRIEEYMLKPPSKRVNYQKLKFACPFGGGEQRGQKRVAVKLVSLGRGVPGDNA